MVKYWRHNLRDNFISRLGALAKETSTAIYAWALLSNHAHILPRSGAAGLPTLMRRLLSGYATISQPQAFCIEAAGTSG